MDEGIQLIHGAGGEGNLVSTYRGLAESGRYRPKAILTLAKIIVGTASGPNKDAPLFELCHLVNALDAAGFHGQNGRLSFFLEAEINTPSAFRVRLRNQVTSSGWQRPGFQLEDERIVINYKDTEFEVRFARMPVLAALFEFLAAMSDWTFFGEMDDTFDRMVDGDVSVANIKSAASALASRFRKYRHAHIDWAKHEERFEKLAQFLTENAEDGHWKISDDNILAFWLLHSTGQEFKGYKTVFDAFVTLQRVIRKGQLSRSVETADVLGSDREAGEIDPGDTETLGGDYGEWVNPMPVFDQDALKDIKFFKGSSERKPIEALMKYGPDAGRLPLAFFRLESFSPVQSAITNDLQMKRGHEWVNKRLSCDEAATYDQVAEGHVRVREHLQRLQMATWHVLSDETSSDDNVVQLHTEARRAFDGLRRKGFDNSEIDDAQREAFALAADALIQMSQQIEGFQSRIQLLSPQLAEQFRDDKRTFSTQLAKIYGGEQ